jgi:Lrp/AsnC family leucine-responsive transcriptional regulator
VLDPAALGEFVLALVLVTLERESSVRHGDLRRRMIASPAVQQIYDLAGEWDYAVLFVTRGMQELRVVVDGLFMDAPNVKRFDTFPVYEVVKTGVVLPLEATSPGRAQKPTS